MRVKIFSGHVDNRNRINLEEIINDWLMDNKEIAIHSITQSSAKNEFITISIFYYGNTKQGTWIQK